MTGRGIHEGDIAIADADCGAERRRCRRGAHRQRESALKTLAQGPDGSFLKAGEFALSGLVPVAELTIQGVVRALIRKGGVKSCRPHRQGLPRLRE